MSSAATISAGASTPLTSFPVNSAGFSGGLSTSKSSLVSSVSEPLLCCVPHGTRTARFCPSSTFSADGGQHRLIAVASSSHLSSTGESNYISLYELNHFPSVDDENDANESSMLGAGDGSSQTAPYDSFHFSQQLTSILYQFPSSSSAFSKLERVLALHWLNDETLLSASSSGNVHAFQVERKVTKPVDNDEKKMNEMYNNASMDMGGQLEKTEYSLVKSSTMAAHSGACLSLAYSEQTQLIASSGSSGTISLHHYLQSSALSPGGGVASPSSSSSNASLFRHFPLASTSAIFQCKFSSAAGAHLYLACQGGRFSVLDIQASLNLPALSIQGQSQSLRSADSPVQFRSLTCLDVHPARPNSVVCGTDTGYVLYFDLRKNSTPTAIFPLSDSYVNEILFSPFDSKKMFVCTSQGAIHCVDLNLDLELSIDWQNPPPQQTLVSHSLPIRSIHVDKHTHMLLATTDAREMLAINLQTQPHEP